MHGDCLSPTVIPEDATQPGNFGSGNIANEVSNA
jgi:hypothetical protein